MVLSRHRVRLRLTCWQAVLLMAASSCAVGAATHTALGQQLQVDPNAASSPPDEESYGVYLPTDRTLSRGVSQARRRIEAGEYNQAIDFLQGLLDRDEDFIVADSQQTNQMQGLKAVARQLISELPAAGRESYELLHTAAARRQLEAALASGDYAELLQVVRRYFLTAPGREASLILAQRELDSGHPLAAAHLYSQLLADPAGASIFEPQLSLLLAVSWRTAGRDDTAAAVLRTMAEHRPDAEVTLAGRRIRLPAVGESDTDLLAWLDQHVGHAEKTRSVDGDWLTLRGGVDRNAEHRGGAPHLSARWRSRVVNDPRFEDFLAARRQQTEQQGIVQIAAARPIAAGNVVLMRTPQNVVAIDWQTGKRIWETREEDSSTREKYLAELASSGNDDDANLMNHPLEQRVWDDTLTMSLSSDGERAFALSGMSLVPREEPSAWGVGPGFGGSYELGAAPTNRLTAYELATEGKLAWEIDGAGARGDLTGVFFLGTPLAVDGSLYVLAEIRSAIYLLALDPASGRLQWRQQLASLEQGIALDPLRRQTAVAPSYSSGVLVCPTAAGVVVALDVVRREFAWVYRYPRPADAPGNMRLGWQWRPDAPVPVANGRWLDGAAVVTDDRVLVTPPDSTELHCLDLASGKLMWKKPREKALLLAGVDQGNVLLVGADSLMALRLVDGAPAWPKEIVLKDGELPTGLGYLSDGRYYLPLSSGQILAVDTSDGTTARLGGTPGNVALGNLICHRGSILSQSALLLDKFEQIEVLRERANSALAANPRDVSAIRDLAEIRRLEGALAEAVPMLRQAYEIDPTDVVTRTMLADALLDALNRNYAAYQADLPLLRKIVDRPQQQIDLLRIEAQGLDAAGERMDAFAAYLRLVDATAGDLPELTIDPQHSVRADRWIRARLDGLWSAATDEDRDEFGRLLEARRRAWKQPPLASDLADYLGVFGMLPGSEEIRTQLIGSLLEQGQPLEAEIEWLRLARSPDGRLPAAATALFDRWLQEQGRPAFSAADGVTHHWPRGRVKVEQLPATSSARRDVTRRAAAEYQLGLRQLRVEQRRGPTCGPAQWLVAQDGSRIIGRDAAGQDEFRFSISRRTPFQQFSGNADLVQAAQLGDLLYVTLGGQVIAIDARQRSGGGDSAAIWQSSQTTPLRVNLQTAVRRGGQSIYHPWSRRLRLSGAAAGRLATLGPATCQGVVYQDRNRLQCVDPLSGETLWSRGDIPTGCELFGDDQYVLAADLSESALYVLRMSDGETIERRKLPKPPWLLTAGRNVAQLREPEDTAGGRRTLRIVDAVSGDRLFETEFDPAAQVATLEPRYLAIVEADGRFQWIDVETGTRLIDTRLPLGAPPRSILPYRRGNQLYVAVNSPTRPVSSAQIGLDYPLVDGKLFAFDLRDGRMLWPGPAVISGRGLALTQPSDSPVIVFVDRQTKRNRSGSGNRLRLLCLDTGTGAMVYRDDELPDTTGGQFRVRTTPGSSANEPATVDIEMTSRTIRLTLTDRPRPPEPPASDIVEAPRKSLGRGLWGVTQRMGSALQEVIENSGRAGRGPADADDNTDGEQHDDD